MKGTKGLTRAREGIRTPNLLIRSFAQRLSRRISTVLGLRLSPGEGAEKAGIPAGAIIRVIDGVKVPDAESAIVRNRSKVPGAVVTITVDLPSEEQKTCTVTLGSAPSSTN